MVYGRISMQCTIQLDDADLQFPNGNHLINRLMDVSNFR